MSIRIWLRSMCLFGCSTLFFSGALWSQDPKSPPQPGRDKGMAEEGVKPLDPTVLENWLRLFPPFPETGPVTKTMPDLKLAEERPQAGDVVPLGEGAQRNSSLQVIHSGPSGTISQSSDLVLVFSQPMVALGKGALEPAVGLDIRVDPWIAGQWRWMGDRTLVFESAAPFPKATRFQVTVPTSLSSLAGSHLTEPYSWEFQTAGPRILASIHGFPKKYGSEIVGPNPSFLLLMDQRVIPEDILPFLELRANNQIVPLERLSAEAFQHLMTEAEKQDWLADQEREALAKSHPEHGAKRMVGVRVSHPLPNEAKVSLDLLPGAPSAEGSVVSQGSPGLRFEVVEAFKVTWVKFSSYCSNDEVKCFPVNLSTWLLEGQALAGLVSLSPEPEDLRVEVNGAGLVIQGRFLEGQSYQLEINGALRDRYGQTLGSSFRKTLKLEEPEINHRWELPPMHVLNPLAADESLLRFQIKYFGARIEVFRVQPQDYSLGEKGMNNRWGLNNRLPGELLLEWEQEVKSTWDYEEARLKVAPLVEQGLGHLLVRMTPLERDRKAARFFSRTSWIQKTRLGLVVLEDEPETTVWVTDLANGQSLENVELRLHDGATFEVLDKTITDERGLASLPKRQLSKDQTLMLVAECGLDVAFLTMEGYTEPKIFKQQQDTPRLGAYFDEGLGLYRQGDTVRFTGWLRQKESWRPSAWTYPEKISLQFHAFDGDDEEIAEGECEVSASGRFAFEFSVPKSAKTGDAFVRLSSVAAGVEPVGYDEFRIDAYRAPGFVVAATIPEAVYLAGDAVPVKVEAHQFDGFPLSDGKVAARTKIERIGIQFPEWKDYRFDSEDEDEWDWYDAAEVQDEGNTNAAGERQLTMELPQNLRGQIGTLWVQVEVADFNQQSWAAYARTQVFPGQKLPGLKLAAFGFDSKTPVIGRVVLVNPRDRLATSGSAELEVFTWQAKGQNTERAWVRHSKHALTLTSSATDFSLGTLEPGRYLLRARTEDDQQREAFSEQIFYVSQPRQTQPMVSGRKSIQAEWNQKEFAPGDVAEMSFSFPFLQGNALIFIGEGPDRRILARSVEAGLVNFSLPIREQDIPELPLRVVAVSSPDPNPKSKQEAPYRPRFESHKVTLAVSPESRRLQVEVSPERETYGPGDSVTVTVQVRDAEGHGVAGGEVSLLVLDQAILALGGAKMENPVDFFYASKYVSRRQLDSFTYLLKDSRWDSIEKVFSSTVLAGFSDWGSEEGMVVASFTPFPEPSDPGSAMVSFRKNFAAVAAFQATLETDAQGQVVTQFNLPDSLTRFRIVALAAAKTQHFGMGEAEVVVNQPLMIKPTLPRFLTLGDRAKLSFTVENRSSESLAAAVVIQTQNMKLLEPAGKEIALAPGERREVLFETETTKLGIAQVQAGVFAGDMRDTYFGTFPIQPPSQPIQVAVTGILDEKPMTHKIQMRKAEFEELGQLQVTVSNAKLQTLKDAVSYLLDYPFACSEQESSRLMALTLLADQPVLRKLVARDQDNLAEGIDKVLGNLAANQKWNSGFGFWKESQPQAFLSIYVFEALALASLRGVPDIAESDMGSMLSSYLADLPDEWAKRNPPSRWMFNLQAYLQHAFRLAEEAESLELEPTTILNRLPLVEAPTEGLAWLLPYLDLADQERVLQELGNRVSPTGAVRVLPWSMPRDAIFQSETQCAALILASVLTVKAEHYLVPILAKGLETAQVKGRWRNTLENARATTALAAYYQFLNHEPPGGTAQVWLNRWKTELEPFVQGTPSQASATVPMTWLNQEAITQATLANGGDGALFYRLAMHLPPERDIRDPISHGFAIERKFFGMDDPRDVQNHEGFYQIRRGARVGIELTIRIPERRFAVALLDGLPAGLEPLNPYLQGTAAMPELGTEERDSLEWHADHQELGDSGAKVFADEVSPGTYRYRYIARAMTPGWFLAPPPKVEAMYLPELFGQGVTQEVRVE